MPERRGPTWWRSGERPYTRAVSTEDRPRWKDLTLSLAVSLGYGYVVVEDQPETVVDQVKAVGYAEVWRGERGVILRRSE